MKAPAAWILAAAALVGCVPPAESDDPAPSIVGSWSLESWTAKDGVPRCSEEEGGAAGQIIYSGDGHMSAQLGCDRLPMDDLASMESGEAIARMVRRHFSYYGTYSLDEGEQTVTHHVLGSTSEAWVGSDRVRSFVFEGPDRIVLSTRESENRLVWTRS